MKVLVVYFSRSGHTAEVARAIANTFDAAIEAIDDPTPRAGIIGYLRSGYEAGRRRLPHVGDPKHDLRAYDLVVVGTPVWNANVSSPVRAFLVHNRKELPRVAFFCTCGGRGAQRAFREMSAACGKSPTDVLALRGVDLSRDWSAKVDRFASDLRAVLEPKVAAPAA